MPRRHTHSNKSLRDLYWANRNALLMRLARACDGSQATMGVVLGITSAGVCERLRGRRTAGEWRRLKTTMNEEFGRARRLRWWWRRRLRDIGVDPLKIPPTDPLWHACFRLPKGELARREIPKMRDELRARGAPVPDNLSTDERVTEFCERVERAKREHFSTLAPNANASPSPPDKSSKGEP